MKDGLETLSVYLVRGPLMQIEALSGVLRKTKTTTETQPGRHGIRSPNGFGQCRVVLDRPPPPDTAVMTWRLIGHVALPNAARYTPLERCKRNHPPLRYLSSGGCVYCVDARVTTKVRIRLQLAPEAQAGFDEIVSSLGWETVPATDRMVGDRRLVAVEAAGRRHEAIEVARALGWEVSLW